MLVNSIHITFDCFMAYLSRMPYTVDYQIGFTHCAIMAINRGPPEQLVVLCVAANLNGPISSLITKVRRRMQVHRPIAV